MDAKRLEEIKSRHAAASPPPWKASGSSPNGIAPVTCNDDQNVVADFYSPTKAPADALFAAHARQDVPDLHAEVERLRAELDVVRLAKDMLRTFIRCDICGEQAVAVFLREDKEDEPGRACAHPDHFGCYDGDAFWIRDLSDEEKARARGVGR